MPNGQEDGAGAAWHPPLPSCSPSRERAPTSLSGIPKEGKQEAWKLKIAGFAGEGLPATADNFYRQQKTCPSCILPVCDTGSPRETWGTCSLAPWSLALHPAMVEVGTTTAVLVSTWV